jgi:hypothetical protein
MGRHTRKPEDGARAEQEDDRSGRHRRFGKVPLLPTVAGVLAIGAIVSAVSTQQISLNFAGGSPSGGASPIVTVSGGPENSGHRTARNDASQSGRVSRGAARSSVAVTVRTTSASARGFQGEATIANHGAAPVKGWTLVLRYAHARITGVAGGSAVRTGTVLIVRNPATRPAIAPGGAATVRFTATGSGTAPSGCTLNGRSCRP